MVRNVATGDLGAPLLPRLELGNAAVKYLRET